MKIFRIKQLIITVVIALLMGIVVTGCAGNDNENVPDEPIRIGLNNWAENIAVCNMWKIILEDQGYNVELVSGEKAIIWSGLSKGDIDIAPEIWLPYTDAPFWDEYKDNLVKGDAWYEGAKLGLVVPKYVDINSIEDLNANKEMLDGKIVGIEEGASLSAMTDQAVEDYGLNFEHVNSSEPAMMATLDKSYQKEEPILVTLWSPHWAFAEYDLKYLEDPKKVFGETEDIISAVHKDFPDKYPKVMKYINNWEMDDDSLGSLMSKINELEDPVKGSQAWVDENQELINGWLKE